MARRSFVIPLVIVAILASAMGAFAGTASAAQSEPGSAGLGDPYFPRYGNGGYDVRHYGLQIRYDPDTDRLAGVAYIRAVAGQNLTRFNLDFVGLQIRSIRVDGERARFSRLGGHELVVEPDQELQDGQRFVVAVRYSGVPQTFRIPGTPIRTGAVRTDDGVIIWGEPEVAAAWFPVNDHPRDKAAYDIDLKVPNGLEAISNGRLQGKTRSAHWTTWHWQQLDPMASYLAVAAIGQFELRRGTTPRGLPVIDALDPDVGRRADFALALQREVLQFLVKRFGPYPFDAVGAIIDDPIGAALETQTRPIYDPGFFFPGGGAWVIVHELAHQWFGDHVAVDLWKHIWLNEGFATYAEWMWSTRNGTPARRIFRSVCEIPADDPFWDVRIGNPGVRNLFDDAVYVRGAATLHALRRAVGDPDFFEILRGWAALKGGGAGSTDGFIALAEETSARELSAMFDRWLFRTSRPPECRRVAASSGTAAPPPPVPTPRGLLRFSESD
jgi:aminopeptidase N